MVRVGDFIKGTCFLFFFLTGNETVSSFCMSYKSKQGHQQEDLIFLFSFSLRLQTRRACVYIFPSKVTEAGGDSPLVNFYFLLFWQWKHFHVCPQGPPESTAYQSSLQQLYSLLKHIRNIDFSFAMDVSMSSYRGNNSSLGDFHVRRWRGRWWRCYNQQL